MEYILDFLGGDAVLLNVPDVSRRVVFIVPLDEIKFDHIDFLAFNPVFGNILPWCKNVNLMNFPAWDAMRRGIA